MTRVVGVLMLYLPYVLQSVFGQVRLEILKIGHRTVTKKASYKFSFFIISDNGLKG